MRGAFLACAVQQLLGRERHAVARRRGPRWEGHPCPFFCGRVTCCGLGGGGGGGGELPSKGGVLMSEGVSSRRRAQMQRRSELRMRDAGPWAHGLRQPPGGFWRVLPRGQGQGI